MTQQKNNESESKSFQTFFRKVEHLTVEGDVHLNAFAFLWAHCQALKYLKIGKTYIIIPQNRYNDS